MPTKVDRSALLYSSASDFCRLTSRFIHLTLSRLPANLMSFRSKNQAARSNEAAPGWLARLPREAALLVCAGIALFLVVALMSYHRTDPGWSNSYTGPARNLAGITGAYLADALLSAFGYVAMLLPWAVLWIGLRVYRGAPNSPPLPLLVRAVAWVVALLSLTGLCALFLSSGPWVHQGAGGIAGGLLATELRKDLNAVGATLLLLTLFVACAPMAAVFSWMAVLEWLGTRALRAFGALGKRWRQRDSSAAADAPSLIGHESALRRAPAVESDAVAAEPSPRVRKVRRAPVAGSPSAPIDDDRFDLLTGQPAPAPITGKSARKARAVAGLTDTVPAFNGEPLPPLALLDPPRSSGRRYSADDLDRLSRDLERHLADFGIKADVVDALPGPVITRFEIQPAPGVKGAQISNLSTDLARAMAVASVRVIEVIEGKSVIGLEIPNVRREMVMLSEILSAPIYEQSGSPLTLGLGKDIAGGSVAVDLGKMPHLLVAGATGAGKSVAINAMILSLLYKGTPEQIRFIFVDPKMLELSVYDGIPHLLTPVVTDMKDAANALRWCVAEMDRRYRLMSAVGVRNLAGLNRKIGEAAAEGAPLADPLAPPSDLFSEGEVPEAAPLQSLPHIVVVIDELADMMMVVGKKVEELIARIAQKARAAGIHLIVATQRPSVDVITGLIKANIPSRIAFQVASKTDSRTILDGNGAETLLGQGDMLYRPIGASQVIRVHGAFVDDHEVHKVVAYLKQTGEPDYIEDVIAGEPEARDPGEVGEDAESDPLYDQAVAVVLESRKASVSWVQRRLKIGYNRAARMVEQMEASGVVGPSGPSGNREILVPGGRE